MLWNTFRFHIFATLVGHTTTRKDSLHSAFVNRKPQNSWPDWKVGNTVPILQKGASIPTFLMSMNITAYFGGMRAELQISERRSY
jgi:hypothetical protein